MNKTNIIMPIAGFGRRFRKAGYAEEKPLIYAGDKTLLQWSLSCLGQPALWGSFYLIMRMDQPYYAIGMKAVEVRFIPSCEIKLAGPTQGAACTVLAAAVGLPPDDPVLVLNADQWFRCDMDRTLTRAADEKWDGFILTFHGEGPAWSYAVTNGEDRVVHVVEKKQVSRFATVGVYWWRRTSDLVRSICAMIASGQRTQDEYFLAPSFNMLPLSDYDVRIVPVQEFRGLGTPEQVEEFKKALEGGWRP